jgi:multidrug resistance efflux pump
MDNNETSSAQPSLEELTAKVAGAKRTLDGHRLDYEASVTQVQEAESRKLLCEAALTAAKAAFDAAERDLRELLMRSA